MLSEASTSEPGCFFVHPNRSGSPEPHASACAVVGGRGRVSLLIPLLVATWALFALTGCLPTGPIDGGHGCDTDVCDDENACTTDRCQVIDYTPTCINTLIECNIGECDPQTGECVIVEDCEDDDPCTDDSWDSATGECLNTEVVCEDDELFCNGVPTCNQSTGECTARGPCDFLTTCDEDTDSCVDPLDSEQCQSQCEPTFERCDERPLEDFLTFEAGLIEAREEAQEYACAGDFPWIVTARCPDDVFDVIDSSSGFVRLVRFYDRQTGQFVAQRMKSDALDLTCWGVSYWPIRVACDAGIVSEVLCGTTWAVGDEITFR